MNVTRESSFDFKDAVGYRDENGNRWMMISKDEGKRKMIYSGFCLVSPSPEIRKSDATFTRKS